MFLGVYEPAREAEKAYFANYSLRVLRILMEHCVDLGWRETNPARGVPEIRTVKREREPWPRELLDAYRATCDLKTRERLVMELLRRYRSKDR